MSKGFIEKNRNEFVKSQQLQVVCRCGNKLDVKLVGGQYKYTYRGTCICGRDWLLEDLSEDCEEYEDCEE